MKAFIWKYWPLFAIGMVLIAIVGMSEYAESSKERYEESTSHAQSAAVAKDEHAKAQNNTQQPYKPPVWGKYVTFPEGVGAWAVILTLLSIVWQSIETRASAQATADSANAAYGSFEFAEAQWQLTRDMERARLDIDIQSTDLVAECAESHLVHLVATLMVRNIGASRAFIRHTSGTLKTKLPEEPLEPGEYSILDFPDKFIDPNQPAVPLKVYFFPAHITTDTFAECLEKGIFTVHFFGFIEYETLGYRWRKDFGYDWKVTDRGGYFSELYELSDPYPNSPMAAKNRITYGYWWANEEKSKPEYPTSEGDTPNPN